MTTASFQMMSKAIEKNLELWYEKYESIAKKKNFTITLKNVGIFARFVYLDLVLILPTSSEFTFLTIKTFFALLKVKKCFIATTISDDTKRESINSE